MIESALEIVNGAELLTKKDFESLSVIKDELLKTWETVQIFRTRTEMEVSVLADNKRPTPDAKYWQAVREQNVMFQELVMLSYEYRKNMVEIKKLKRDILKEDDEIEIELSQIEIEKKQFIARNMERTAHDRIREILEWSNIKTSLKPYLKYGDENVNAHQFEAMKKRYEKEAALVTQQTPPADASNILGLWDMVKKGNKGDKGNGIHQIK